MPPTRSSRASRRRPGADRVPAGVVDRAPADRQRLLGYEDPGGVFTVMIQLGSILAVMWLYRAKIVDGRRRACRRDPEARRFALMIVVGVHAGAGRRRAARRLREDACCTTASAVIAVAFIVGGIVMLVVERLRPAPDGASTPSGRRSARALGDRLVSDAGADPGVSRSGATIVGGDADGPRPPGRGGVLVLSRDADDGRGVRARSARGAAPASRRERALEIAVGFVMAFLASLRRRQAVPGVRQAVGLRAVRLVPHRARRRRCSRRSRRGGCRRACSGCAAASSPASSSRCRCSSASPRSSGSSASSTA